jgi:hypothetical protein
VEVDEEVDEELSPPPQADNRATVTRDKPSLSLDLFSICAAALFDIIFYLSYLFVFTHLLLDDH